VIPALPFLQPGLQSASGPGRPAPRDDHRPDAGRGGVGAPGRPRPPRRHGPFTENKAFFLGFLRPSHVVADKPRCAPRLGRQLAMHLPLDMRRKAGGTTSAEAPRDGGRAEGDGPARRCGCWSSRQTQEAGAAACGGGARGAGLVASSRRRRGPRGLEPALRSGAFDLWRLLELQLPRRRTGFDSAGASARRQKGPHTTRDPHAQPGGSGRRWRDRVRGLENGRRRLTS